MDFACSSSIVFHYFNPCGIFNVGDLCRSLSLHHTLRVLERVLDAPPECTDFRIGFCRDGFHARFKGGRNW
jgi:hypothetical protein